MGNAELKTAFKNALKDQQSKDKLGLTAEILLEDKLVTSVEEFIKEKMNVGSLDIDKAFPENNIQINENAEDLYKRQLISELNENYISGFATAESNIESLKEPSFEKFFTVNSPDSIKEYTKLQQQKFVILYALFVEKYKEQQDKKQNFFDYISKFLEKQDVNQRVQVGLESGFKFSLSLLKEIKSINKDMLINSLEYLYQTLRYAEPGSLYSTDKLSFMIDSNLNDARSFLVSIIEDKASAQRATELAFKIIFLLGIVRSNVEDLMMVSTLLDKHHAQVDLRQELELLKEDESSSSGSDGFQKKSFTERKTTKQGTIFYLKAGTHLQEIKKRAQFACDGQFIYMHQEGLGLLKMGTGSVGQMIGQVYQHKSEYRSSEHVSLLYLNGKLYCRSESLKPKPFVTIDPQTLEEDKDEYELEKEDQNLEWKENEETGRSLTYTPLFSDGSYIYVVAQKKAPKKKKDEGKEGEDQDHHDNDEKDNKPPMLVIEAYDPTTLKFVKDVYLYKNEDFVPFMKSENSIEFIKDCQFVTNGQTLLIQTSRRGYFFDMKTGVRLQKVNLSDYNHEDTVMSFDYQNSVFYSFKHSTSDTKMQAFTIANFKKGGASFGFAKEYLTSRLQNFRSHIFGDVSMVDNKKVNPGKLNVIQRIMKNVTTPVLIQHSREASKSTYTGDQLPQLLRAMILRHIEKSCQNFGVALEEIKSQGKSSSEAGEHMMKFFKYPNATYLTHTLFQQVQQNLERNISLITSKKTVSNLPDQYSFYFILKILTTNFQALSFCSIALPDIMDEDAYQDFLKSYRACIVKIIEEGYSQDFEAGENQQEMKMLWSEIYQMCLKILSTSINLIYAENIEIIKNVINQLGDIQNEKQAENASISLNFLSMPENSKKLLQADSDELKLTTKLFEECCQIKSKELNKLISENTLGNVNPSQQTDSTLVQASSKFIKGLSEQLIVQYCALTEQISSKQQVSSAQSTERDERDKRRLKDFDIMLTYIFEHSANEIAKSIRALSTTLQTNLDGKADDQWDGVTEQYEKFSSYMDQLLQFNSAFYSIVTLYVQTFSVFKVKTSLLPSVTNSVIGLIHEISSFYTILKKHSEKLNVAEDKDKLKKSLDSFSRNLCWFIGMSAYKLIRVKEVEKDQEKKDKESGNEKMQDLIIQSNLLSGGIENRYITQFSTDVQQHLQDLIKISNDSQLQKLLKPKQGDDEEDLLLGSLIHEGKDEKTDRVIRYLQQFLERKVPFVPYARLGGVDGMRLSRAAFAVMIKFSEFFEDFQAMVDEIDMTADQLEGDAEKDIKLKEHMKGLAHYEHIAKRWESASKMRQWINEKKKNLIERLKKEVETEYTKKKEEEKKKADEIKEKEKAKEDAKEKPEEVKVDGVVEEKKEDGVEQIDTSSKEPVPATTDEEAKVDAQGLTEEDKAIIDDLTDQKFNVELQKIYEKIVEKAEFIIKLQVPVAYLVKDPTKKKEGSLLFIKEPSLREGDGIQVEPEFDWKDRLKSWRQMQTSKGAIKSFTDRKKEIFDSSVMSILACLQTAITAQRIKKQVETVFLNANKRVAGLRLLGQLLSLELPQNHRFDLMNWFCSSLRGNKNQLSHYLDDLRGCGHHLEEQARENFFQILKGLVKQLRESKDEPEIKAILNSLKWKYYARDHSSLRNLEIFKVLHEGDGKKDNKLKKAWGRPLKQEVVSNENDKKLTKEVIDVFEQIFLLTVGRIIKPDTGAFMKLKQKGTSVPTLEKAQSVIDENVSEHLIAQSFDVIFKEFERYIKIMKMFKGVDWTIYVKMRNKERKQGEGKKEYDEENLLDEEEEEKKPENEEAKNDEALPDGESKPEESKEEVKPEAVVLNGDAVPSQEEEKKDDGAEDKKEGEDGEEQKEEEDLEEKEKQEAIKKQEERAEKEMKSIYKLYSESFLRRLLRLVEIFTSIATVSPYPLSMVQRVANPFQLETLLNLLILSSPRIKIVVLKVIQNLIKIAIPFEVFEETITIITRDTKSQAYEILNKVVPSVQFEDSKFLKFLYNYLLSVRHKMWTKSGIESEGQYAVTQEISHTLRTILENDEKHEDWRSMISTQLKKQLLRVESLSLEEIDVIFSIISGGDFQGVSTGSHAMTKDNQLVTILGYSEKWQQPTNLVAFENDQFKQLNMNMDLQKDIQKIIALFYDPQAKERQEIIQLNLHDVIPIPDLDQSNNKRIAQLSILNDSSIVRHFLEILQGQQEGIKKLNSDNKVIMKQLQLHILKSITHMINVSGSGYLEYLQKEQLLDQFVKYLYESTAQQGTQKTLTPIDWVELKCSFIKKAALENDLSLVAGKDQMTATIQNEKQVVLSYLDPETMQMTLQNTYLVSAINIHNVPKGKSYSSLLSKDLVNFVFEESNGREYGLVFLDGQELIKMDERVLQILLHSQAVLTTSDISAKEVFTKMIEEVKKDDEKPETERKLEGLLETVILFVKRNDFERVQKPLKLTIKPLFQQAPNAFEGILRELEEWGGVSRDSILLKLGEIKDPTNFSSVTMNVIKALKDIQEENQKNKDKLKKLEADKKIKELEAFKKRLAEVEQKREKELLEKKAQMTVGSNTENISIVEKIAGDAEKQEVKIEDIQLLELLSNDKRKEEIQSIIDKNFVGYKQESSDDIKQKSDLAMSKLYYESVKGFDESLLPLEYEQTLTILGQLYSRKSLVNILAHADLSYLLPVLLKGKKNQKYFSCFIKSTFNDAVQIYLSSGQKAKLREIKGIFTKVFEFCEKSEEFSSFMSNFLMYDIIESGIKTVNNMFDAKPKNVRDYFNTEEQVLVYLNPYLLRYVVSTFLRCGKDFLMEKVNNIPNIFNICLAMNIFLQSDEAGIFNKLLSTCLSLLNFIEQDPYTFTKNGVLDKILNNELFDKMISAVDYDSSDTQYTKQQKLLLEIHLKLLTIHKTITDKQIAQVDTNLVSSTGILKVKRGKQVLQEREKFDFLKYFIHYQHLDEHERELIKGQIETAHYAFDSKVLAKYQVDQVQKLKIKFSERTQLKDFTFLGIANNSKGMGLELYDQNTLIGSGKEQELCKGEFYVFYPVQKQMVIAFGEGSHNRLGLENSSNSDPKLSMSTKDLKPALIKSSYWHSVIVDKEKDLYRCGQVRGIGNENATYTKMTLATKISLVALGKTSIIVLGEDNKLYGQGISKDGHLGINTNYDNFTKMPLGEDDELNVDKVIQISSGTHYSVFVTESGKLYGAGNRFLKEIGMDGDSKIVPIPLPEGLKVQKAFACMSKKQPTVIIQVINDKGEEQLWSAGRNDQGLLGQGSQTKISKIFRPMKYDNKSIQFKQISIHSDHAMAIDQDGKLYAWGNNGSKRSGFHEDIFDGIFEPREVKFLKDEGVKALRVETGFDHALLLTEDDNKVIKLYSIGQDETNYHHLGITQQEAEEKDKYYRELIQFRGINIIDFAAGHRSSHIIIEGDSDPRDRLYEHKLPTGQISKGLLHFYKNEDGQFTYVSSEDYEAKKNQLPDLCFAIKCPIENMESKLFPDLNALAKQWIDTDSTDNKHNDIVCSETEKEIEGARYLALTKINGDDIEINLSEGAIKHPTEYDINPLIYYRIKKPLKQDAKLPYIDLRQFYKESGVYGLDITVEPDLQFETNKKLIELTQTQFNELNETINKFPTDCDQELIKEMDRYVKVNLGDKAIGDIKAKEDFKIADMTFQNPKFKKLSEAVKRRRIELYLAFNSMFLEVMPYLALGKKSKAGSLAQLFSEVKHMILFSMKNKFIQSQINNLPTGSQANVEVARRKAQRFADTGKVDHKGEYTIFGQIYQQIKKDNPDFSCFRQNGTEDKTWRTQFKGEGSIDAGGPFREGLTNICAELESDVLPLFIKTPNNRNNHGQNRDCFIPCPSSNNPTHFEMYKFFGRLLGFAIRSLSSLPIHLPSMFWKQLLNDTLDLNDLKGVDTYSWQVIEDLKKQASKLSNAEFEAVVEETFVTRLSDGTEAELCKDGKEKKVTKQNLDEYIELLLQKRFTESVNQTNAIREGVDFVIPIDMLKLLTWEEVESRACGDKIIEPEKLKKMTEYQGGSAEHEAVERFWRVFEAFTEEEKQLYLKFVWGRSRLPYDTENCNRHTIYLCTERGDVTFPEAHTCFFQLDLPWYKSDEICKQRLITAITLCGEIDTDNSARWIADDDDADVEE